MKANEETLQELLGRFVPYEIRADLDDPAAAFVYSANRWPPSLPDMPAAFRAYYDAMATLVERVMSLMALGLGLAADAFAPAIDRHTSALRALRVSVRIGAAECEG